MLSVKGLHPELRHEAGQWLMRMLSWLCVFGGLFILVIGVGGAIPGIAAPFRRTFRGPITVESPNGLNRVVVEATDDHATVRVIEGSKVEILGDSDKLDKILDAVSTLKAGQKSLAR